MKPWLDESGVTIYHGDCREILPQLAERFDACITDPPYHLTSVSRNSSPRQNDPETPFGRTRLGSAGFMGKTWDGGDVAFRPETWEAVLNVLKPGAHLMAFGGTRTNHRLACAIEDAGFEIRDMLMWLYGSGFPKSLDISKAIDKAAGAEREVVGHRNGNASMCHGEPDNSGSHNWTGELRSTDGITSEAREWCGYGTALKPAYEPIILGMKPLDGTFAGNALKHRVAGLNIDGSRIEGGERDLIQSNRRLEHNTYGPGLGGSRNVGSTDIGRWPANVLLDQEAALRFPDAPGQLADASTNADQRKTQNTYGAMKRGSQEATAERRYTENGSTNFSALPGARRLDTGSAARFFYTAKAGSSERGTGNNHPTVKPLDLMRYLCKLLCPPAGGILLEPFMGSGSTVLAGRRFFQRVVAIELEEKYCEIAAKRLSQEVLAF